MEAVSAPPKPVATGAGLRRVLVMLCVTEITSWGILFYAFPVLLGHITTDTGWSATALTPRSPPDNSSPPSPVSRSAAGSTTTALAAS